MREFLTPVNAVQVQTELGLIYVVPGGRMVVQVSAPHLTDDGIPLQASAYLSSNGEASRFDLISNMGLTDGTLLR